METSVRVDSEAAARYCSFILRLAVQLQLGAESKVENKKKSKT